MATEEKQSDQDQDAETTPETEKAKTPAKAASWRRLLTRKWIAILIVASIAIHGIGFACSRLAGKSASATSSPEVSLGVFRFEAGEKEAGRISNAEFSLHIALLDHVDQAARQQLETRRFRVQQDVEELLRRAHSGDFDDPKLGELKRQLQEQINESLGIRAIADVIITDLELDHRDRDLGLATDTAESVPWVERPSG
jgi:flagellar basal body-associated protein FliL